MSILDRRAFLKTSALAMGAGLASRLTNSAWANPVGANDAVRIGIIGLNNKGRAHLKQLQKMPGVRVTALCDVDPRILHRALEELKGGRAGAYTTTDARKLLARSDVDAVVIVTTNHWHALLTVWGCQAGKDVYVEKPMSRTVREGRKMVEAGRKYGRIVQVGTQYRSDQGLLEAEEYIRQGNLGKILHAHTVVRRKRDGIGRRFPWYPDWLDYDLLCGSVPMIPLERNELHYDGNWMWDMGNGEIGANGIHVLDIALRFVGHKGPPRRVLSMGGRFVVDDVAETPNTMLTVYDYPDIPIFFENRNLAAEPGVNHMDHFRGLRVGFVVQCEGGYFAGLVGGAAYDNAGERIKTFPGDGGKGHMANFLDAVRSRRAGDLASTVEEGHVSTSLVHHGNISYRIGETSPFRTVQRMLEPFPPACELADGLRDHLRVHGIDLERRPFILGSWVKIDGDGISGVGSEDPLVLEHARFLLRETERPPYVIPDHV